MTSECDESHNSENEVIFVINRLNYKLLNRWLYVRA
jgi:hypothetical protein